MKEYLETVTLGTSFSKDRTSRFMMLIEKMKTRTIALHLLLVSLALNFPIMFSIARLSPYQVFSRLYAENFVSSLPDDMRTRMEANTGPDGFVIDEVVHEQNVDDFNTALLQNDYGKIAIALMGIGFLLVIVLQTAFYLTAGFCMGLQRMVIGPLSFRSRIGILAFSSTLPVFASALIGLWMPALHIVVFYFAVILIGFWRSKHVVF